MKCGYESAMKFSINFFLRPVHNQFLQGSCPPFYSTFILRQLQIYYLVRRSQVATITFLLRPLHKLIFRGSIWKFMAPGCPLPQTTTS